MYHWSDPIKKVRYLDQSQLRELKIPISKEFILKNRHAIIGFLGGAFLRATFQDLHFSLNKCLFPRDSLGLAKGAIRKSCQKIIQCNLSFQSRPGPISERLRREANFSHKKQEDISRAWCKEGSQSVVPRLPGEEDQEPETPP